MSRIALYKQTNNRLKEAASDRDKNKAPIPKVKGPLQWDKHSPPVTDCSLRVGVSGRDQMGKCLVKAPLG